MLQFHSLNERARDTARKVKAKKMAAKKAIITSKQPRTKAETTSGQAVAMRKKKIKQHEDKKGNRDREEVETSEHATDLSNEESKAIKVSDSNEADSQLWQMDSNKCKESIWDVT